jgi:hypothetical protein
MNRLYWEIWVPAVRYISRLIKTTAKKPCFSKSGDAASIRAKGLAKVIFWKNCEECKSTLSWVLVVCLPKP